MFKDDELHETRYCENCLKLQQELQEVMDNYVNLDLSRVKEYNELVDKYKAKEQECKVLALDARVADNHLQHRIEMCDLLREKLKAKEQECDKLKFNLKGAGILGLMKRNVQLKKALDDIEINISEYQGLILDKPRTMRENDCIYNILNIIDKVKELK